MDTSPKAEWGSSQRPLVAEPVFSSAFLACVMVMFADMLGTLFVEPVSVPYGMSLGASLSTIAAFNTVRFGCNFISMMWMPACADRFGSKLLLLISIGGSATGYLVQGLAGIIGSPGSTQIGLMFAGRAISGFFSGTKPVLQNSVTLVSLPDEDMVRTRLTILTAAEMTLGTALAPTAGALAQLGLNLPWLASAVLSAMIFILTVCVFHEPPSIPIRESTKDVEVAEGNPWKDRTLLTMACALFLVGTCVSGDMMALPVLLSLNPFGFLGLKAVANATGLVGIPRGISQLLFSTFFFLAIVKRIGDVKTCTIGGLIMALSYVGHAFAFATWQVALLQAVLGCGLGLLLASFPPILARYAVFKYPKGGSQASSVAFIGFIAGMMVGPLIMSALLGDGKRGGVMITYLVCAGIFAFGTLLISTVLGLILVELGASKKNDGLSPEQMGVAMQSEAIPVEQWIEQMCDNMRQYLTKGSLKYRGVQSWSGFDQKYFARVLDRSFPQLPAIKDDHLKDEEVSTYIAACMPLWWPILTSEEQEDWRQRIGERFPGIKLPGDQKQLLPTFAPMAPLNLATRINPDAPEATARARVRTASDPVAAL